MASRVRILVADADPGVCGPLCESLLSELGDSVDVCRAPPGEAARLIAREPFDLVFSCGLEGTRRLASLMPGRSVTLVGVPSEGEAVLLSDLRGLRAAYLQVGASLFLPAHPAFDSGQLLDLVRRVSNRA